jgi:hypothetical protein
MQRGPTDDRWLVRARVGVDDLVVSISERELAGRDLSESDEELIRDCARHLLSFVGKTRPAVPSLPEPQEQDQ